MYSRQLGTNGNPISEVKNWWPRRFWKTCTIKWISIIQVLNFTIKRHAKATRSYTFAWGFVIRNKFLFTNQIPAILYDRFSPPYFINPSGEYKTTDPSAHAFWFFVNINCFDFCDLPKVIILSSAAARLDWPVCVCG